MTRPLRFRAFVCAALCCAGAVRAEPWADLTVRGYAWDADARKNEQRGQSGDLRAGVKQSLNDTVELRLSIQLYNRWDSGDEDAMRAAWGETAVTIHEPFLLPLSLSAGRLQIHREPGIVFSGKHRRWLFDGVSMESDSYPWNFFAVVARVSGAGFRSSINKFAWLEMAKKDKPGAYPGVRINGGHVETADRNFQTAGIGALYRMPPGYTMDASAAFQWDRQHPELRACLAQALISAESMLVDNDTWSCRYIYSSGNDHPGKNAEPLFDEWDLGVVFHPDPVNIHSVQAEWNMPVKEWTAGISGYAHWQDEISAIPYNRREHEYPSLEAETDGLHRYLGSECTMRFQRTWKERHRVLLSGGVYFPGAAMKTSLNRNSIWGARLEFTTSW